jgi:hypothetical protein
MSRCTAKAPGRLRKATITMGWSMGSLNLSQALVDRLIASVQIADERMGFVQPGGMLRRVPLEAASTYMRQRCLRDNAGVNGRVESDPLPPPLYRSVTGAILKFSPLF